ncbi:MAG: enoyl-CoA hydratase/isomerase family protein [Burkholderiaceae bacterium]
MTSPAAAAPAPMTFEERATASGHRIGFATLDRPRQLNALNLRMCQMMLDQFRAWQSDEGIVAVVLQGAGDKGFCAGGDVADVIRRVREGGPRRFVYGDAFFDVEYQLDYLIHTFGKPFIAYSHGVCMGGGVGLFAGASHRVLAERTKLAMPEIHIGLFPDVGGGFFLNRVPAGIGRILALTGLIINEADALFAGLADAFVPLEMRDALWADLLAQPFTGQARRDREIVSMRMLAAARRAAAGLPESNLRSYFDALRVIAAMPTVTALRDALLAAAQEDPWFETPAASLANGSPTAAFVTFEYLERCRHLSLREVLALDLVLATNCQRRPDFVEGVRALLIDKDKSPKWSPASFDDVDRADVLAHFSLDGLR